MMELPCPCGRTLGYEARHVGMKVRCPGCQRFHIVPDPANPPEAPPPARLYQPPGFLRIVGELLYTGPALTVMLFMVGIGIGLLVYANREGKLSSGATELPRSIPCRRLIEEGPGGNPHVLVTDAIAGQNYFTRVRVTKTEQASGNTSDKPWEAVYLPLVPLTPEIKTRMARGEPFVPPPANSIRLVLVSNQIRNKEELGRAFGPEGAIQGLIVNAVGVGGETADVLRQKYPGIALDRVLILEPGRKPMGGAVLMALFVTGVALVVSAGVLGVVAVVYRPIP
jgi:hypothetical protein